MLSPKSESLLVEILETFQPKPGTRQVCLLYSFYHIIVWEDISQSTKNHTDWNWCVFSDDHDYLSAKLKRINRKTTENNKKI